MELKTPNRLLATLVLVFSFCLASCQSRKKDIQIIKIIINNSLEHYSKKIGIEYDEENFKANFVYPNEFLQDFPIFYFLMDDKPNPVWTIKNVYPTNILDFYIKDGSVDHAVLRPYRIEYADVKLSPTTGKINLVSDSEWEYLHYDENPFVIFEDKSIKRLQDLNPFQIKHLYCICDENDPRKQEYEVPSFHHFVKEIYSYYLPLGSHGSIKCELIGNMYPES